MRRVLMTIGLFVTAGAVTLARAEPPPTDAAPLPRDVGGLQTRPGPGPDRVGALVLRRLMRPLPEDNRPLGPGEREELRAFAEEHLPRLSELLPALEAIEPGVPPERVREVVARLRQLKRIYDFDPKLGEVFRRSFEQRFELKRLQWQLRRLRPGGPLYERAVQGVREHVSAIVELEIESLRAYSRITRARFDEFVDQRTDQILTGEGDLMPLPPLLREQAQRYAELPADSLERARLRERVRTGVTRMYSVHLEAMAMRIGDMEANAAAEVDQRVEAIVAGRRPPMGPRRPVRQPDSAPAVDDDAMLPDERGEF